MRHATRVMMAAMTVLVAVAPAARAETGGTNAKGMSPDSSVRPLTISANEQVAYSYFIERGLSETQTAGVVGNLDEESGMDPAIHQGGGGPGRGIAQWSVGGRWDTDYHDNVLWYAGQAHESSTSLVLQLQFIWYELNNFSGYGLSQLRATTSINGAVVAFQDNFEGCGDCHTDVREADAQGAYNRYHGAVRSGGSAVYTGASYHVFWTRPSDGHMMQSYYSSGWHTQDLGGVLSGVPAATYHSGRYDLFAVSPGGQLYHKYYTGSWSSWTAVTGAAGWRGGVSAVWTGASYHVFGHNSANHLMQAYYSDAWHVQDLGGITVGTPASMYHSGRYDVFSVAPSNHHLYQRTYTGSWGSWHVATTAGEYGGLGVAGLHTGASYQLFALSGGAHLYHEYYEGGWHGPGALDGTLTGSVGVTYHGGRYDLFGPAGGGLYQKTYTTSSGWGSWHKVA